MSVLLYMDHHIDFHIIAGLRCRGIDVLTARDDLARLFSDDRLIERAVALGRVLCTEDKDFFRIAHHWWQEGREFPGIIHVDQDAAGIGVLIEQIALIAEAHTPDELRNRLVYVPLR